MINEHRIKCLLMSYRSVCIKTKSSNRQEQTRFKAIAHQIISDVAAEKSLKYERTKMKRLRETC